MCIRDSVLADRLRAVVDRVGDVEEVLEELGGYVLVRVVMTGELQGDRQHVEAEHRHPARAVALIEAGTSRQLLAPIEYPDVVEAKEPALEDVSPLDVLPVHPPREVDEQFMKDALEERRVFNACGAPLDLVDAQCCPGMDRWVDVAERPLVRRKLTVRVHEPLAQQEDQLILGEPVSYTHLTLPTSDLV